MFWQGNVKHFYALPEHVSLWTPWSLCLWSIKIPPFNLSLVKPSSRRTTAFVSQTMPFVSVWTGCFASARCHSLFSNAFSDSWAGLKRQTSVLSLSIRIKYFFWLLEGLSAGLQLLHNYNTMHLFAETEQIDVKQWRQRYVCIRVASVPSLCMVFQLFYWRHYPAPSGYITINSSNTLGF